MERVFAALTRGPMYWIFLTVFGLSMEALALYYQYGLDYGPCVLCIHVRMLTLVVMVLAVLMLWLRRFPLARAVGHAGTAALMIWLGERAWQLIATERGWILGDCAMQSGLPDWLALEKWFPLLFQIYEPCGYTPDMPFGLTMAEVLIGVTWPLAALAVVLSVLAVADLVRSRQTILRT